MLPQRISVKITVKSTSPIELDTFIGIFQRWIQQHTIPGLLIDVADYKHVPQGPGIILIGHEGDTALDVTDGIYGLQYTRKRQLAGSLVERLTIVWQLALTACQQLEADESLNELRFDTGDVKVAFIDRLNAPNRPDVVEAVQRELLSFATSLYGDTEINFNLMYDDPRELLALRLTVSDAPDVETLLTRLQERELAAQ